MQEREYKLQRDAFDMIIKQIYSFSTIKIINAFAEQKR